MKKTFPLDQALIFKTPIPLSLYIHLPWCVRKCPYCDFNSHEIRTQIPEAHYVQRLLMELESRLPEIWGRRFSSIFFGGGTPSLFSPDSIDNILRGVNQLFPFQADIEITLEANPGTIDEARFAGFKEAGINRLSLGVQSFDEKMLKTLGRIHGAKEAKRAIETALKIGFENFNIDLMHGLPGQTVTQGLEDLQIAMSYQAPHLSWYQLTLEPQTFFHKFPPVLPEEDVLNDIQQAGKNYLLAQGLRDYEVSAFAKPNKQCQHNLNYWQFGDYLGLGAGAHSKLTFYDEQCIKRTWQVKNPKDYLNPNHSFLTETRILGEKECIFEFMLNALRLRDGVTLALFETRTGLPQESIQSIVSQAKAKGLLADDQNKLFPTTLGFNFLNDLTAMFLP